MRRGNSIVGLCGLAVVAAVLSSTVACAPNNVEPQVDKSYVYSVAGLDEGIRRHYDAVLALFQAVPLRPPSTYTHPNGDAENYETIRLLIAPSFRTYWLVGTVGFTDSKGKNAYLIVKSFNPYSDSNPLFGKEIGSVLAIEKTIKSYMITIPFDQFERLREPLATKNFVSKKLLGKPLFWNGTREKIMCLDGTSYYVEALTEFGLGLISRGGCNADFAEDFRLVLPLIDTAIDSMPVIGNELAELRQEILNHQISTELPS